MEVILATEITEATEKRILHLCGLGDLCGNSYCEVTRGSGTAKSGAGAGVSFVKTVSTR